MAIITRPNKTGGGTDFVAGNDVLAEEFNGDANTIVTDYNGNVTNANCAAAMGLVGTKLADAPNGVPTAKINDGAVTGPKFADAAVTAAKVATDAIIAVKLKTAVYSFNQVGGIGGSFAVVANNTGLTNIVKPLSLYVESAALHATFAPLIISLHYNTNTSTWWIIICNPTNGLITITNATFKLVYVTAS